MEKKKRFFTHHYSQSRANFKDEVFFNVQKWPKAKISF